jgi:hypothetical protein
MIQERRCVGIRSSHRRPRDTLSAPENGTRVSLPRKRMGRHPEVTAHRKKFALSNED